MFRFKKRKSRNRVVTKTVKVLRLKIHRLNRKHNSTLNGVGAKLRLARRASHSVSSKPLRLKRGSVKHVAPNNNNHYQPPARVLKVSKPLTSKPPCQKRKERRSVLLAKGLGGAIHKPRKWNASSFEKCGG